MYKKFNGKGAETLLIETLQMKVRGTSEVE
jgi:hypothetical protein